MARSKNVNDFMIKRFRKNGNGIPKNMESKKMELISKMKKGETNSFKID